MDSFRQLGLLNQASLDKPVESWPAFLAASMGQSLGGQFGERDLVPAVQDLLGKSSEEAIEALRW